MFSFCNRVISSFAATAALLFALAAFTPVSAAPAQLVVVESARCPYCVAWERTVGRTYSTTEFGKQAPLRRIDIQAQRPKDLAKVKEVHVTPTFVLVDEGQEVGRIVGYNEDFWPQLKRLMARLPVTR